MSMMLDFRIVGGQLKIEKYVFTKEMLIASSLVKTLLSGRNGGAAPALQPVVSAPGGDGYVTVDYNGGRSVSLGQSPGDLLKELKMKYRGSVRGRLTCRGSMYTFEIDLNGDGGEVAFVMD